MHVSLGARAHDGLREFAADNDVTMTALLDAVGEMLADGVYELVDASVVERAAAISKERRRRAVD